MALYALALLGVYLLWVPALGFSGVRQAVPHLVPFAIAAPASLLAFFSAALRKGAAASLGAMPSSEQWLLACLQR